MIDQEKFQRFTELFESARDGQGQPLNMHYLLVRQGDQEFVHRFNGRQKPSDIRSLCKTIMSLIAGIVAESHDDFDEEMLVWPILERVASLTNLDNLPRLQQVKVKHLLNHTIGFDQLLMMRGDIVDLDPADYVNHVVNTPIVHDPGVHYLYSNAGFYLLSVVLQEYLGEDLYDYANRVLFAPLGIINPTWERYGNYVAGATRLWLQPEDLRQIGKVLLEDGAGIVSAQWLERLRQVTALTPGVDTPTNPHFRRHAYAHGLWLGAKDGIYFGHGTDGQTLAIVPQQQAIVVTTAHQVRSPWKRLVACLEAEHRPSHSAHMSWSTQPGWGCLVGYSA